MTVEERAVQVCEKLSNEIAAPRLMTPREAFIRVSVSTAIAAAIRGAIEEEREACAVIAETAHDSTTTAGKVVGELVEWDMEEIDQGIAAAIRARKDNG